MFEKLLADMAHGKHDQNDAELARVSSYCTHCCIIPLLQFILDQWLPGVNVYPA